jgi:DNA invertase Pin-like site-specific DNA recombinase
MRAAIYVRISGEDEGNVDNTDIQVDESGDFIDSQGWECVGVYVDDNLSAYSKVRRKDTSACSQTSKRTRLTDVSP